MGTFILSPFLSGPYPQHSTTSAPQSTRNVDLHVAKSVMDSWVLACWASEQHLAHWPLPPPWSTFSSLCLSHQLSWVSFHSKLFPSHLIGPFSSSTPCSMSLGSLRLWWPHLFSGLEQYLYASDFQIHISSLTFSELQICLSNCLCEVSSWIRDRNIKQTVPNLHS